MGYSPWGRKSRSLLGESMNTPVANFNQQAALFEPRRSAPHPCSPERLSAGRELNTTSPRALCQPGRRELLLFLSQVGNRLRAAGS